VWIIGTPWTTDDLYAELEKEGKFFVYKKGVGGNFESHWPERWTSEELREMCKVMGEVAFNRSYRLIPFSSHDIVFPPSVLKKVVIPERYEGSEGVFVAGCDLGVGEKGRSYTVVVTLRLLEGNVKEVVSVVRGKFSSPETAEVLSAEYSKYKHLAIGVENNAYQGALIEWLSAGGYGELPIVPVSTLTRGNYIRMIAQRLSIEFDQGLWRIPKMDHTEECGCDWCELWRELSAYPFATLDDCVSALCIAAQVAQQFSGEVAGSSAEFDSWT
jgi:hypothetical protein